MDKRNEQRQADALAAGGEHPRAASGVRMLDDISLLAGHAYLGELVNRLPVVCGVEFGFVSIIDPASPHMATTSAMSRGGVAIDNFAYNLEHTPCANVVGQKLCCYPAHIQQQFPDDLILVEMGIESYAGVPLFSITGAPLGLLVLMDTRPMADSAFIERALRIVAGRAGAELERALSEQALRRREAQLLAVIENSPGVAMQWYDRDGRVILWNRASEEMFGILASVAVGKTLDNLTHTAAEYAAFVGVLAEIARTGAPVGPNEFSFRAPSGQDRHFLSTQFRIPDMSGGDYFVCMDVDITDRKKAEEALRASEARLRTIIESEPECVKLLDAECTLLEMNPAGLRMIAAESIDQVRGLNTLDLLDPKYHEAFREGVDAIFRGETTDQAFEIVALDGSRHWMEQHAVPMRDPERPGTVKQMLAVTREITDRKRAEDALKESEARYRLLIENTADGIFITDKDGRYLDANRAGCEMFGYTYEEMLHVSIEDILAPEEHPRILPEVARLAAGGAIASEWRFIRKDGSSFHGELKARRMDESRFFGSVRDTTERRRAEADRLEMESKFQQAQKLEGLGVLAGGIAHDFNNLLTGILGYSSLAMMELPADSPVHSMLAQIEKAAQQAAGLTQQMLAYSGRGKFVVQALDLDALVSEMIGLLRTVVSKKAEFVLDLAPATIEADGTQIRQIVMNLITNASEALGGSRGEIRIRSGTRHMEETSLRSEFVQGDVPAGDYAFLEVSDTGCGMGKETLARLFDPFYTTKFTGRGLGLAAVLGIVRGHRGTIHVTSEIDRGTTFEVLIPAADHLSAAPHAPAPAKQLPRGRGKVLVVDDEEHVRVFVTVVLERSGFEVLLACDGEEGLKLLERHKDEILVMLLDVSMPRLDGVEVLQRLHKKDFRVPVMLMSGYAEADIKIPQGMESAVEFLQKPFRPIELIDRLNRVLAAAI